MTSDRRRLKSASPAKNPAAPERTPTHRTLDLKRYVPYFLRATANITSRMTSHFYQKFFGISIAEWRVLSMLAIEPNSTAARICEARRLDAAAVSRSIRILQHRGEVRMMEDSADGRQQRLTLTPKGQTLHDRIVDVALQLEQQMLAGFTARETEDFIGFLSRLETNATELAASMKDARDLSGIPLAKAGSSNAPAQTAELSHSADLIETQVADGRLRIRAEIDLDGITRLQQVLTKYGELLKLMS
jgi:DNA-binding MarR family transcriptional regulator